jgi:hypothetical protein
MASRVIVVPSFEFSAFYYAQILEALIVRKRIDVPELTDESDFEPFMQLLRSFALVGHLNNVLLDVVANENTLPTSQLVETVRNMLQLISYDLASAAPASGELVYELARVFNTSFEVVPALAQAATRGDATTDVIYFEALTGVTVSRTDQFTRVQSSDGGVFADNTDDANDGTNFVPWTTPTTGDAIYFGHDSVMWDELALDVIAALVNIVGVWEYYDGDLFDVQPTSVANIGGGQLSVDLTSLLGTADRRGATVRVTLNETGVSEDVLSTWNGTNNIATTGLLGQTSPSVITTDYTIGSAWSELAASSLAFADATDGLTDTGVGLKVGFDLPQTEIENWQRATINGVTAFWLRFRIVTVSGPTSPTLARCRLDTGTQYAIAPVTQGRSVSDDPVGSSNGGPNQSFQTSRDYFIDGSEVVTVDDEPWTRVKNFLGSSPQDKHYAIALGDNDRATVRMGDGVNGRIPALGQGNVSIEYRFNAEVDGNVGANTIVVDKTGLTYVNKLYNPRQAGGWAEAEGASTESLERAKLAGPATLRTKEVALNGDDAIVLALAFRASDGTKPFSRATYIEEGFGPKTVELILCGSGGVVPTSAHLREIELYFNGDKFAAPPVPGHFVGNQKVFAVAFDPFIIDVVVDVEAPEGVTEAQIKNGLAQVVQPEALKADGVTFEWNFGGRVPVSRLTHEVFKVDDRITDVDITTPGADRVLSSRQLPVAGNLTVNITES